MKDFVGGLAAVFTIVLLVPIITVWVGSLWVIDRVSTSRNRAKKKDRAR